MSINVTYSSRLFLAYLIGFLLWSSIVGAQSLRTPSMATDEIKPGMTGIGKTIFYGNRIDEFGVEVLDVMKNVYPQRDLIIVRLTGEKAEKMGIVSGMSGSPIYIDGKLIGALSMRLGDFQKEPIAGVTPFADMVQAADKESLRGRSSFSAASWMDDYLRGLLIGSEANFWQKVFENQLPCYTFSNHTLRPIESPMNFSGFSDQVVAASGQWLSSFGFLPQSGGHSAAAVSDPKAPLQPGSAVSQVFVAGDLGIDATGTLTAIDGDKILAFGHYIFNLGETNLPLGRSRILATLPSLFEAKKLAVTEEIIGVARQDRVTGIYGELGRQPEWIPVRARLQADDATETIFNFRLANDAALSNIMPFFLRTALFQALVVGRLAAAPCAIELNGKITFRDQRTVQFSDFFAYEQQLGFLGAGSETAEAADFCAKILGALMVNDFPAPAVTHIDINARIRHGEHVARLQSISLSHLEAKPGDSLTLSLKLRRSNGKKIQYHRRLQLPRNLQSKYITIFAGSASAIILNEIQKNPDKYRPNSFEQLLNIIENRRRNNMLFIQMREAATGLAIAGEELNALPPSIMNIMDSRSDAKYLREREIFEDAIFTEYKITGFKKLSLKINQPPSPVNQKDKQKLFSTW